jgi:hypothetical protein
MGFRELNMPETQFPGTPLLGDSVNKEQVACTVPKLVYATKFRDVDKETSFRTAHEMF